MKYIYIFDHNKGRCEIYVIFKDPEEWLESEGYNLNDIQWMVTEQLNLFIDI